jgi:hypothetical protein
MGLREVDPEVKFHATLGYITRLFFKKKSLKNVNNL